LSLIATNESSKDVVNNIIGCESGILHFHHDRILGNLGNNIICDNCDVSLTYHQYRNQLRCHYCGYNMAMLQDCMACGSQDLDNKGFGTEQIEEEYTFNNSFGNPSYREESSSTGQQPRNDNNNFGYDLTFILNKSHYNYKCDIKYGSGKFFEGLGDKMIDDFFTVKFKVAAK